MIHVVATVELNPGTREAFLAEFNKLVPTVLAEVGCVSYTPTIDFEPAIPGQTAMGPDRVVVVEQWQSIENLAAHGAAPHMKAYRQAVKPYVRGMELRILQAA
ncbi:putative quinol monooxygenase [Xenophilus arseniciresistens]|uniref:Quinol monooxygenase n=1 Tax=Xenophilus arseniciresistens TaxID=1283306 RepID=A0AAE3N933_9BURK|nr:putative quinol monooxygenase [Xenophilus arseniciresistens]MDA7417406.1 putative quinol monooxygenase [Xenophilus arseniciresistens]